MPAHMPAHTHAHRVRRDSTLPDDELEASIEAAEQAGVCLVLGSSLQIAPANEIPLFTCDNKGKVSAWPGGSSSEGLRVQE